MQCSFSFFLFSFFFLFFIKFLYIIIRVNERTAVPTSVVIMAINSLIGMSYIIITGGVDTLTYDMFLAAVPAISVGGPLGK
jgi:uncharacterized protein